MLKLSILNAVLEKGNYICVGSHFLLILNNMVVQIELKIGSQF